MAENSGAHRGDTSNDKHDQNKTLYHWVYVAGFCIFSAFVDFTFLWPESHAWALLALSAVLSLILIYELTVIGATTAWTGLFVIMIFMLGGGAYWIVGPNLPPETEGHGWLLPANEPTPLTGCGSGGSILFVAGTVGFGRVGPGKTPLLNIGGATALSVEQDGAKLMFDADIFDANARLVARILRNEFHLISGQYSYRTRSDDRSKLTVFDAAGKEMLYVNYANSSTVIIRGDFTGPDGTRVLIDDNGISFPKKSGNLSYVCFAGITLTFDASGTHLYAR